jgi:Tol biopolymer transport system component
VDFNTPSGRDVWILSLTEGTLTRATFDRDGHDATWTPDGQSLTYTSAHDGAVTVFRLRPGTADPPARLFASPQNGYTGLWLRDGSALVTVASGLGPEPGSDIAVIRNAGTGPLEPLVMTPFEEQHPAVSPDGRWLAFTSNQSGVDQVYVRPLDRDGEQVVVSLSGGMEPLWSPDGRDIFYRGGSNTAPEMMAAAVRTSPRFVVTARQALFPVTDIATATPHINYDVSPDGRTFVMVRRNPAARIVVIQHLPAMMRRTGGTEDTRR